MPLFTVQFKTNTMKCNQAGVSTSSQPHCSKKTICIEYQLQVILKHIKTTPIANAPTGFRWQKKTSKEIPRPIPFPGFFGWTYEGGYFDQALNTPLGNGDINLHSTKSYGSWCFRVFPGSNLFGWKTILTNKKKLWVTSPQDVFFFPWWKTPFFGNHRFFLLWTHTPTAENHSYHSLTSTVWCSWRLEMQLRWNWCLHCIDATSLSSWRW